MFYVIVEITVLDVFRIAESYLSWSHMLVQDKCQFEPYVSSSYRSVRVICEFKSSLISSHEFVVFFFLLAEFI